MSAEVEGRELEEEDGLVRCLDDKDKDNSDNDDRDEDDNDDEDEDDDESRPALLS